MSSRPVWIAEHGELWLSETDYDAGMSMREHAHAETCVSLLLRGSVEERAGRTGESVETASIGIKPAHLEHSDRFGPAGARTLKLRMGPGFVERLEEFSRPVSRWRWVPLGAAAPVMLRMRSRLSRWRPEQPAAWLEDMAIDLLAALHSDDRLRHHPTAPPWLLSIRREVIHRFREGVLTRVLAERAGVHPVYLARAFRRSFGESISECVRRLRVQEAARLLEHDDGSVSSVAYRAGFADQSHLTRTFRRETSLTPRRWQAL